MKYALFAGAPYYPKGGIHDFIGWYDSIEAAKKTYSELGKWQQGWAHITDENLNPICNWYVVDYLYDEGEWKDW